MMTVTGHKGAVLLALTLMVFHPVGRTNTVEERKIKASLNLKVRILFCINYSITVDFITGW